MIEFPVDAVTELVGSRPAQWSEATGGYTPAGRWRITTRDGSAFVKAAHGPAASAIRREASILGELSGSFHPRLLGYSDTDQITVLITEDLSDAIWPPPYPEDPRPLFSALEEVADHGAPPQLSSLRRPTGSVWSDLSRDRAGLHRLGVYTDEWLDGAIGLLADAEAEFDPTGDDLVHNDLWSGNIAFVDGRCIFVDWAEAHRGSRWVDRGFASLSLRSDGGRQETERFPGDLEFAAWWSASLSQRLIRGIEPWLDPGIEDGLRQDLIAVLPWVARLLGLPPLETV